MTSSALTLLLGGNLASRACRANWIFGGLFVVTIVGIGSAVVAGDRSLDGVERQHAKVEKQFAEAAIQIQQFQQMQAKARTTAQLVDSTSALLEKVPRSILLAKITNSLPANVSLLDLELDSPLHQAGNTTIRITGVAATELQVGELIRNLNSGRLFQEVKLIVSDSHREDHHGEHHHDDKADESSGKFQIEMTIRSQADLQNADGPLLTASIEK